MLITILIILLILCAGRRLPALGLTAAGWGIRPSGIVGVLLIVVLVLAADGTHVAFVAIPPASA